MFEKTLDANLRKHVLESFQFEDQDFWPWFAAKYSQTFFYNVRPWQTQDT